LKDKIKKKTIKKSNKNLIRGMKLKKQKQKQNKKGLAYLEHTFLKGRRPVVLPLFFKK
jgi:hypothetical protein